jgi:hypothetical protein
VAGTGTVSSQQLALDAAIAAHGVRCQLLKTTNVSVGPGTVLADLAADFANVPSAAASASTELDTGASPPRAELLLGDATFGATAQEEGPIVGCVFYFDNATGGKRIINRVTFTSVPSTLTGIIIRTATDGIVWARMGA